MNSLKLTTLKTRMDGSQYRLIHPIAQTREFHAHAASGLPLNQFRVPKRFRKI